MSTVAVNLMGFPAVNHDLTVQLRDPLTRAVVATAQPFSDGTVRMPTIPPGAYEMHVLHPNLTLPILTRPIRVLPGDTTTVSVLIDPSKFRDTPIVDQVVANLTPVQQTVDSISQSLVSISTKTAGEAIRAEDWNALVNGVRHLADAVSELSRVVSPLGHNHPELEKKIEEMQTNFTGLVNQVSPALVELQRQINALRLQQQVSELFDKAPPAPAVTEAKNQANVLIQQLHGAVSQNPLTYGITQRDIATQLQTITETVQASAPANDDVKAKASALGATTTLMRSARTTTYEGEVAHNRLLDRAGGGGGLIQVLNLRGA
jgi:uncharacterized protein YoxC